MEKFQKEFAQDMAEFINEYREFFNSNDDVDPPSGFILKDEAKTSVFIFNCLWIIFGYDFVDNIIPQQQRHGVIDYCLTNNYNEQKIIVEVKKFNLKLRKNHIDKYLKKPKGKLRIGLLTNYQQWQIYIYSYPLANDVFLIYDCEINELKDFENLYNIINEKQAYKGFKKLKRMILESPEIAIKFIKKKTNIEKIAKGIRKHLYRDSNVSSVPQNKTLKKVFNKVLEGEKWEGRYEGITYFEILSSITSKECMTILSEEYQSLFGLSFRKTIFPKKIRKYIKDMKE